ncbi:hypothetical protein Tco_0598246 [Tanacetum coccineum]
MKSITEGPFQMGMFIQTPAEDAEETEGALQLGPERARVFTTFSAEEKGKDKCEIDSGRLLELTKVNREITINDEFERFCQIKGEDPFMYVRDRYNMNNQGRPFSVGKQCKRNVVAGNVERVRTEFGNMNPGQAKPHYVATTAKEWG